jgi:hypothetical protein
MERIRPHFPRSRGIPRVDDRRVLSGIVFVIKGGLRWRDAPPGYGPHKTLDNRSIRWSLAVLIEHRSGSVINEQFEALRSSLGRGPGAPIDNTLRITNQLYQQLARLAASPAGAPLPVAGMERAQQLQGEAMRVPPPMNTWLRAVAKARHGAACGRGAEAAAGALAAAMLTEAGLGTAPMRRSLASRPAERRGLAASSARCGQGAAARTLVCVGRGEQPARALPAAQREFLSRADDGTLPAAYAHPFHGATPVVIGGQQTQAPQARR